MMHLSEYSCCICYMREKYMCPPPSLLLQLKGSDLELTIVKGSSAPRAPLNGPACTYVNLRLKVNNKEQGGTKWHWTFKPVTVSFKAYILSHCPACLPVYLVTWLPALVQRAWCCWRIPEGTTEPTWTGWKKCAAASLEPTTRSSECSVTGLVRAN